MENDLSEQLTAPNVNKPVTRTSCMEWHGCLCHLGLQLPFSTLVWAQPRWEASDGEAGGTPCCSASRPRSLSSETPVWFCLPSPTSHTQTCNRPTEKVSEFFQEPLLLLELEKKYYFTPDGCDSVGWALSHKLKGHWFNSQSGHTPGL